MKILFTLLFLFMLGCAELGTLTPRQTGGTGVLVGAGVQKVKTKLEDIAELKPYLKLYPIEICEFIIDEDYLAKKENAENEVILPDWIECSLSACENQDGSNCKRLLRTNLINFEEIVIIKKQGIASLFSDIKGLCLSPHENFREVCKQKLAEYSSINKKLLVVDYE